MKQNFNNRFVILYIQEYFKKQSSDHPIKFRYLNDVIETLVLMLTETEHSRSDPLCTISNRKYCFSEIHYYTLIYK